MQMLDFKEVYRNKGYSVVVNFCQDDADTGRSFFQVVIQHVSDGNGLVAFKKLPSPIVIYPPSRIWRILGFTADVLLNAAINKQKRRLDKLVAKDKDLTIKMKSSVSFMQRVFDKIADVDDNGIKRALYAKHKKDLED